MARILILEDEPLISMMVEDWVKELFHEAIGPTSSVSGALQLIKTERPDAAIIDVSLRQQTSYPVADALLAEDIPFAFTTGRSGGELSEQYPGAPVLQKPFDFAGVRRTVDALLSHAKS